MSNKNFIHTDYFFPVRAAVFVMSNRESIADPEHFRGVLQKDISPAERQQRIQSLVERFRPELKGCFVYALQYQIEYARWEIAVYHGSLPERQTGEQMEPQPLIPESWRERGSLL
jgi:hypothetical protein